MLPRLYGLFVMLGLRGALAGRKDFGCLNFRGETVDWFFMYKEPNGQRYLYYDAEMAGHDTAASQPPHVLPLSHTRKMTTGFNVPDPSCPLVKTIAQAQSLSTTGAMNTANTLLFSWNDQKDSAGSNVGHAKGMLGLHYEKGAKMARSFFIQHTLPRFSATESMFESNLESNAQHFFCMSFEDRVEEQKGMVAPSDQLIESSSWFRLLWLYGAQCRLNYLSKYTSKEAGVFASVLSLIPDLLAKVPGCQTNSTKGASARLPLPDGLSSFEIRTTARQSELALRVLAKSASHHVDIYDDVTALLSIHHHEYSKDKGTLRSNARNVSLLMIAQSYVDRTTLGLNQKHLCSTNELNVRVHIVNSFSISLPVFTPGMTPTEPIPITSELNSVEVLSPYKDHSKWSINVIYGQTGYFPPVLCFYDLNRTGKQAKRGGGAFCLNSSLTKSTPGGMLLWHLFMTLKPCPSNMARFVNAPMAQTLRMILPGDGENREVMNTPPASNLGKRSRPVYLDAFSPDESSSGAVSENFSPQLRNLKVAIESTPKKTQSGAEGVSTRQDASRTAFAIPPTILERAKATFKGEPKVLLARLIRFAENTGEMKLDFKIRNVNNIDSATHLVRTVVPCPYSILKVSNADGENGCGDTDTEEGPGGRAVEVLVDLLGGYRLETVEKAIELLRTGPKAFDPQSDQISQNSTSNYLGSANRGGARNSQLKRTTSEYRDVGVRLLQDMTQTPRKESREKNVNEEDASAGDVSEDDFAARMCGQACSGKAKSESSGH